MTGHKHLARRGLVTSTIVWACFAVLTSNGAQAATDLSLKAQAGIEATAPLTTTLQVISSYDGDASKVLKGERVSDWLTRVVGTHADLTLSLIHI